MNPQLDPRPADPTAAPIHSPVPPQPTGPTAQVTGDDRTLAAGAHAGSFLAAWIALGVLAPVLVLVLNGTRSAYVRHHAYESLNFQLNTYLWLVAAFLFGVLTLGIGWVAFVGIGAWYVVFVIIATLAAKRGEAYRYPLIIRFFQP